MVKKSESSKQTRRDDTDWGRTGFAFQVSGVRFQGFGFGPSDFGILLVFVSDFDIRISDFESLMSWRDQWPKSKAQSALRHALSPMRDSCKGTGQQR
jgi:hypothetical protein